MKKLLVLLLVAATLGSQAQTYSGNYLYARKSIRLYDWTINSIQRDTNFISHYAVPTSKAVAEFINGRLANLGEGNPVLSVYGRTGTVDAQETDYQSYYPRLSEVYLNPAWLGSLHYNKIFGHDSISSTGFVNKGRYLKGLDSLKAAIGIPTLQQVFTAGNIASTGFQINFPVGALTSYFSFLANGYSSSLLNTSSGIGSELSHNQTFFRWSYGKDFGQVSQNNQFNRFEMDALGVRLHSHVGYGNSISIYTDSSGITLSNKGVSLNTPHASSNSDTFLIKKNGMVQYRTTSELGIGEPGIIEEEDPTVPSNVKAITAFDIANWNGKENAIGYTTENVANKASNLNSPDNTKYPTTQAVSAALGSKVDTGSIARLYVTGGGIEMMDDSTIRNKIVSASDTGSVTPAMKTIWDGKLGQGPNNLTSNLSLVGDANYHVDITGDQVAIGGNTFVKLDGDIRFPNLSQQHIPDSLVGFSNLEGGITPVALGSNLSFDGSKLNAGGNYLDFNNVSLPSGPGAGKTRISTTDEVLYINNGDGNTLAIAYPLTGNYTFNIPSGSNSTAISVNQYARLFTRQALSDPTGTVTINVNSGAQAGMSLSTAGARTLAFSNIVSGDIVKISINNTTGGTVTLTLPSNSFVAGTGSAANVTIPTGRSMLTLSDYDGTNYLFVQQSY